MTEVAPSSRPATLTLRVAEARVEDVGHAIARLAPADLLRLGARAGNMLKITGGTIAVGRTELSDEGYGGRMEGLTGADIESLCKKAKLLAIAEFQDGTRVAPFVVLRSDFLAVLESERGSPKQLKKANALRNSAGDLCPDASTK